MHYDLLSAPLLLRSFSPWARRRHEPGARGVHPQGECTAGRSSAVVGTNGYCEGPCCQHCQHCQGSSVTGAGNSHDNCCTVLFLALHAQWHHLCSGLWNCKNIQYLLDSHPLALTSLLSSHPSYLSFSPRLQTAVCQCWVSSCCVQPMAAVFPGRLGCAQCPLMTPI